MSTGRFVTVKYLGGPAHLASVFRMKGYTFAKGAEVEVPDHIAGMLIKAAPTDSIEVVKGEPVHIPLPAPPTVKKARQGYEAYVSAAPQDAKSILEGVPGLAIETLRKMVVKEADAIVNLAQVAVEELPLIALWAKLSGKSELSDAAARLHVAKNAKPSS